MVGPHSRLHRPMDIRHAVERTPYRAQAGPDLKNGRDKPSPLRCEDKQAHTVPVPFGRCKQGEMPGAQAASPDCTLGAPLRSSERRPKGTKAMANMNPITRRAIC